MKLLVVIASLLVLAGCASTGRKLDEAKINQIKKGQTTREDVIKLVGSPDQMMRTASGETTFTYTYFRATAKASSFIPIVGAFAGGADVQNQMLMVTFGPDNLVKDYVSTYGATDTGTGLNAGSKPDVQAVEADKRAK